MRQIEVFVLNEVAESRSDPRANSVVRTHRCDHCGVEIVLVVGAAVIVLTALAGFAVSRADETRPIRGSGDMTRADAEARARSAGIDHTTPPGW